LNNLEQFVAAIDRSHQPLSKSIAASIEEGGERLKVLAEDILEHYKRLANDDMAVLAKSFATMVLQYNRLQYKYEVTGKYVSQNYDDVREAVYDNTDEMTDMMFGLVCSQFGWPNHFRLWCFFEDNFLAKLSNIKQVLEIAPGHGYFGLNLLRRFPEARLTGIDISSTSVDMSRRIAVEFKESAAEYHLQDARHLTDEYQHAVDAIICGELLEHVPHPEEIFSSVGKALRPGGLAYVTAAITAAAPDHIYEFETPEQVIAMAEGEGFSIVDQICEGTKPLTSKAKGPPRTLSMILTKR